MANIHALYSIMLSQHNIHCGFNQLFIKLPKLREGNRNLKRENAGLKQQKSELEASINGTVQQLQSQMLNTVNVAVEKANSLQVELKASNSKVAELERQLAYLQSTQIQGVNSETGE